jgi:hypothetical protein
MRKYIIGFAGLVAFGTAILAAPVSAAPRQVVVVVADGLNPQVASFGGDYLKASAGEDEATSGLSDFKAAGKTAPAAGISFVSLRGLLKTAAANGYKTGFVSTDDVTKDAATLYDLPTQGAEGASTLISTVMYDFIAGGGRANFAPTAKETLTAAGGTALFDADSVESLEQEIKGKTLVLQGDAELPYAIDQNPENEAGLSELVTLAVDTLSADNAPYLLVVHDTLLNKALAAKDTPALAEEFRAFDGIVAGVLANREDNPDFAAALLATGSSTAPRFTTNAAGDRSNSFFILSQLPVSFAKAGATLKGADEAALTEFATEQYKGWNISGDNRAALLAGTLDPEAAVRASYEPALNLAYETVEPQTAVYTVGLDADLVKSLIAVAATKPVK